MNIGLNNKDNKEDVTTLYKTIREVSLGYSQPISNIKLSDDGGGNWNKERVAVIQVDVVDMGEPYILDVLDYLCTKLNQDAIAYKINGIGFMRFNKEYTGERFKFKEEYFINI